MAKQDYFCPRQMSFREGQEVQANRAKTNTVVFFLFKMRQTEARGSNINDSTRVPGNACKTRNPLLALYASCRPLVACDKCGRGGRYGLRRLIKRRRRDTKLITLARRTHRRLCEETRKQYERSMRCALP